MTTKERTFVTSYKDMVTINETNLNFHINFDLICENLTEIIPYPILR